MDGSMLSFGAGITSGAAGAARQARRLEELGFDCLSSGEHYMRGNPPGPTHAALPLLAVAAGATERIRVVSSIVLAPFYHPTVLAKLTTTLDIASGGRLTLGIGVGGEYPVEFEAAGLRVDQRGRRTNECLEALRRLWTEEHVSYRGRHFQLDDVTLRPRPTQQPHPPVWVSGRRDAAMARAARLGDGRMPYFYDPARYRDSVEKIENIAREDGRDLAGFQWAYFPYISIYDTVEQAAEVAARALGGRYLRSGGFSDIVHRYCLLGPVESCIARLQEYIDAGARHVIFSVACDREDRDRHIETIAGEIIPHFKGRARRNDDEKTPG